MIKIFQLFASDHLKAVVHSYHRAFLLRMFLNIWRQILFPGSLYDRISVQLNAERLIATAASPPARTLEQLQAYFYLITRLIEFDCFNRPVYFQCFNLYFMSNFMINIDCQEYDCGDRGIRK